MLIKKYTIQWIEDFNQLKNKIDNCLHNLEYSIEHIGSTSVSNLDSKPIIDIDIIYNRHEEFEKIKVRLEENGYDHKGNQGIEDREVFKRNGKYICEILDSIQHHLYVCPYNSKALERHLLSRNFLQKNEWARIEYQQIKYALADKANQNKKIYASLKELYVNDFIDSIIEKEKQIGNSVNHNKTKY